MAADITNQLEATSLKYARDTLMRRQSADFDSDPSSTGDDWKKALKKPTKDNRQQTEVSIYPELDRDEADGIHRMSQILKASNGMSST